mgnify:CR=1 FL=1
MLGGESYEELLVPSVWKIFKELNPDDFPDVISSFKGEYDFFFFFYGCSFVWQGIRYNNVGSAFHASKYTDEAERKILSRMSAEKVVKKSVDCTPSIEWEESKLDIMESILLAKFDQNPSLKKRLIETDGCILINGNNKHETYWGVDLYSWKGENHLGKILMTIRDKEKKK